MQTPLSHELTEEIRSAMNTLPDTTCAYCNVDVPDEGDYVPAVNDDEEWERLATYHDTDCEWILTRAHRINLD